MLGVSRFHVCRCLSSLAVLFASTAAPLQSQADDLGAIIAAGEPVGPGPFVESLRLLDASPTRSQSIVFEATFSTEVLGVDEEDFVLDLQGGLAGASVTSVAGAQDVYFIAVDTGTGDGLLRVDILYNDTIYDLFGGSLEGEGDDEGVYTGGDTAILDRTAPTVVSILHPDPDTPLQSETTAVDALFSEDITAPATEDFVPVVLTGSLPGLSIQQLAAADGVYRVTVGLGTGVGTFRVDFADRGTLFDSAGNPLGGPDPGDGDFTNSQILTVNRPLPAPAFSATPLSGIAPLEVSFSDETPTEAVVTIARAWDFGPLGTADTANPTVLYTEPGLYTVSLTVTNAFGAATETKLDYIEVLPETGEGSEDGEGTSEGSTEGALDGEGDTEGSTEGAIDGEGDTEGSTEGAIDGEGDTEGTAEGAIDGEGDTEGTAEGVIDGEGDTEGSVEGTIDGEGDSEGATEGVEEGDLEGEGTGDGEGAEEGSIEGTEEGAVEGTIDGEGDNEGGVEGSIDGEGSAEGEGAADGEGDSEGNEEGAADGEDDSLTLYKLALINFFAADTNRDRRISLAEIQARLPGFTQELLDAADANSDNRLSVAELLEAIRGGIIMSADTNGDSMLSLAELLRLLQLYNARRYACAANAGATEDGFEPGPSGPTTPLCLLHSADIDRDSVLSLSEMLRAIQFFNIGRYVYCAPFGPGDGFCPED
jgi:PKD repeat protein